jgi:hypothetical protein
MKKPLLALCFLLNILNNAEAQQNPIVVQSGTTLKYASSLDSAVLIAVNGDAIYLPSGTFPAPNNGISKKINIYGAGYRLDSAYISGITQIMGDLTIRTGASGALISGVDIVNRIVFECATVDNLLFKHCKIERIEMGLPCNGIAQVLFESCVIMGNMNVVSAMPGSNSVYTIQNSIIASNIAGSYINISNSILLNANNGAAFSLTNSIVTNSIIFANASNSLTTCTFSNNLVVGSSNFGIDTTRNTYKPLSFRTNVFERNTTNAFDERNDYHLKSACTECLNKGIYAGGNPFRPTPLNPQFMEKQVSGTTNNNYLKFRFKIRL